MRICTRLALGKTTTAIRMRLPYNRVTERRITACTVSRHVPWRRVMARTAPITALWFCVSGCFMGCTHRASNTLIASSSAAPQMHLNGAIESVRSPWARLRGPGASRDASTHAAVGRIKWQCTVGSWMPSEPSVGKDGTVYVGDGTVYVGGGLSAYTPDGSLRWRFAANGWLTGAPAIGPDGTVYVGSAEGLPDRPQSGSVFAIKPDGTLKWRFRVQAGSMDAPTAAGALDAPAAVGSDGTVYVGCENRCLYAISPAGTLRWRFQTTDWIMSSPVVDGAGTVYAGSGGYLWAVGADGRLRWRSAIGKGCEGSPLIGPDGTVYVGTIDGDVYAFKSDGTLLWRRQFDGPAMPSDGTAPGGTVYVATTAGSLYSLRPDGTVRWRFRGGPGRINDDPAVGADGTAYFGLGRAVYAVDANGALRWRLEIVGPLSDSLRWSPAIGRHGTIYVTCIQFVHETGKALPAARAVPRLYALE